MNIRDIEYFAKKCGLVSPSHDTNWFDPAIVDFVKQIEKAKCEELAKKIEAMPFGDTGASFAAWIRSQE